jgi:hypothetical protein
MPGFTPPPEKIAHALGSAVLTPALMTSVRGSTWDCGAIRLASGEQRWLLIDAGGHWTLTATPAEPVTQATHRLLATGTLQADGTVLVGSLRYWLVDVELCDGTKLAVGVAA